VVTRESGFEPCGCATRSPTNAVCPTCGKGFICPQVDLPDHDPDHDCFGCWYAKSENDATLRFSHLVKALRAHGVEPWSAEPWQTGGMVYCLAIPLFPDRKGEDDPNFLMGDYGDLGSSLDVIWGKGLNLWPTAYDDEENERVDAWTPERAEQQAAWFAGVLPVLRSWFTDHVTVKSAEEASWDAVPEVPGTEVSEF